MIPKVSIIIPNYNHALFLKKRIQTCLDQTYQDFELIILDDCSTDNSRQVIEQYKGHPKIGRIVYNTTNSGSPFKQWQKGFELAKGIYIWIAESDDYADSNFLELMIQPMENDDAIVISYCRSLIIDKDDKISGINADADVMDGKKWNRSYIETGDKELSGYLNYKNTIPNASGVVFRNLPAMHKMLNTGMKYCGDWWFWKNMLRGDVKIAYCHLPLNYFRTHNASTRSLALNKSAEVAKFKELNKFIPALYFKVLDNRYRWIMDMWIERSGIFKNTFRQYVPILHPTLIIKYYLWLVKKNIFQKRSIN